MSLSPASPPRIPLRRSAPPAPAPGGSSSRLVLAATAALALAVGMLAPASTPAAAATLPEPDGLSELTAAASCWEIKQRDPASTSGVYWLVTPQLGAPERFYCDQTTSGGGWVLVGRGRENWSTTNEGRGTAADVRSAVTGPAAFAPRQLPARTIEALLDGKPVSSLPDGIRLRRATATDGSAFQEVSFTFSSPRDDWSWMFNNQQRVKTWKVGARTGSGGTTSSFGTGTAMERVQTSAGAAQGWVDGFGFGETGQGSSAASSYIWKSDSLAGYARPFTQVFLRPQLTTQAIVAAIPDQGTPAVVNRTGADSSALPTVWGVNGLGAGPRTIEGSNEVSAFAESAGVVYVGGNFTRVQRNAAGSGLVAQSYLAAFDAVSGELIIGFRPSFNNQVKSLAALPDGRIAVGGFFTTVNGAPAPGLVVLDPTTGATSTSFTGRLVNRIGTGSPIVRSLDVQDGWLYVAGNFTHAIGGSLATETYIRNAGRLAVGDGTPDVSWNPEFNGTVMSLDASARGDRTYTAGFFTTSRGVAADKGAALSTTGADVIPWPVQFSNRADGRVGYQQAVREVGDQVWLGGSEHSLFSYGRESLTLTSSNITIAGGDFQAIASDGTTVYAGCHCFETNYSGTKTWGNVGTNWTQASKINSFGAWDSATGRVDQDFSPTVSTRAGAGGWALFVDSRGTVWAGGDYTYSERAGNVRQWSGGFIRYPARTATAPATPTGLAVTASGDDVQLGWSAVAGASSYQVLRNDRVVATSTTPGVTLPAAPDGTRYFVRAADGAGNISASTPVAVLGTTPPVDPPSDPAVDPVLVAPGSTWSYRFDPTAPDSAWRTAEFDDSSWAAGAAPLGWGHSSIATTLTTTAPQRPIVAYYRKSVSIADVSRLQSVQLTTRADDGIVVSVNGVEVARKNLDAGPVSHSTYANAAPSTATAVAHPLVVTVPGSAFTTGANLISAEVHSNYRSTPTTSFDLGAVATLTAGPAGPPVGEPVDPPTDPQPPVATPVAAGTVLLAPSSTWSYTFPVEAPAAGWSGAAFDAASWTTAAAPFGWGSSPTIATQVTTTATPKPSSVYFRAGFDVPAGQSLPEGIRLTTRADDGIIVFVNGTEVGRSNLIAGQIGHTTYANSAPSTAAALATAVAIDVPASVLVSGTNSIAVQVVSNYRNSPSVSFDLSAVAR